MRLLRYRPRTVAEARRRLRERGHRETLVDETVERACAAGLLDDRAFTKLWIDDRLLHKPLSRRAIQDELTRLGIPGPMIREHLAQQYPPNREPRVALDLAEQRLRRVRTGDPAQRIERVVAYLVRRGFGRGLAIRSTRAAAERLEETDGQE
jgi:regulatory protein